MKEVVVEKSMSKILFLACGSLLLGFFWLSRLLQGNIVEKGFDVFFIFFCAMFLFVLLRALFKHEGAMVINEEGFADNISLPGIGIGFISWEQVEEVRLSTFLWMRFISVKIKDARNFEARIPGYAKIWIKLNKIIGYSSVNISLGAAKKTYRYKDVVGIMQGFLDASREQHGHVGPSAQ